MNERMGSCPCPWCWKMAEVDFLNNTFKCYNCNRNSIFKNVTDLRRKCRILKDRHKSVLTELDSNKNCPFCGSKSSLCFNDHWLWEIGCSKEGPFCSMQEFDTLEEAVAAWNART